MSDFVGMLEGKDSDTASVRIRLNADTGDVSIGGTDRFGDGVDGRILIRDADGGTLVEIQSKGGGSIVIRDTGGEELLTLDSSAVAGTAGLRVGAFASEGGQRPGWLAVRDEKGVDAIFASGSGRRIEVRDDKNRAVLLIDGQAVNDSTGLMVGAFKSDGGNHSGWVAVRDDTGNDSVFLDGENGSIRCGTSDLSGDLFPTIGVDGTDGSIELSAPIVDESGFTSGVARRIVMSPKGGSVWLGGNGQAGDVVVLPAIATSLDTDLASIWVRGSTGDIILRNADCAEEFDMACEDAEPGTVMTVDQTGRLAPSEIPYDKRVVGVVSGAGGYKPAIVLDRRHSSLDRAAITLTGKTYCKVDAHHGVIEAGDLLTTSPTVGHAMKATEPGRAFGAVLGKALLPQPEGTGLIPVLIALQ